MLKKKKIILVLMISVILISSAIIKVSSELPQFIKDRSNIKIYLNINPFDLRFDTENYIVYINQKALINIENNVENFFNNIYHKSINEGTYISEKVINKFNEVKSYFGD